MPQNNNSKDIAKAIKNAGKQAIALGKAVAGKGSSQNPVNLQEVEVVAQRLPKQQGNASSSLEPLLEKQAVSGVSQPKNRWQQLKQQAMQNSRQGSILDGTTYGKDYGGNYGSKYAPTPAVPKVIGNNAISRALAKGKLGKILGMAEEEEQNVNDNVVFNQSTNDTTCNLISSDFNNFNDTDASNNSNYYLTPKEILCQTPAFKSILKQLNSNPKIIVQILDFASQTTITDNMALGFTGIMVRTNNNPTIGLQAYTGTLEEITQFEIQTYSRNNNGLGIVIENIVHEITIHAKNYFNQLLLIINNRNENAFNAFRQQYINDVSLASNPINTINTPEHNVIRNFSTDNSDYKTVTIAILEKIKDLFKDKVVNDVRNPNNLYEVTRTLGSKFDSNGNRIPNTGIVYTEPKSMYNKYLRAVLLAVQTYSGGSASTGMPSQYILTQESPDKIKYPDIKYLY